MQPVEATLLMIENPTVSDTSPEAERILIDVYRRMSPGEKWRQLGILYRSGRVLAEAGARWKNPAATLDHIRRDWMTRTATPPDLTAIPEPKHGAAC